MENFYRYLNIFPMPLWLAMMFAPHHPLTERASRSSTIFGLAALNYLFTIGLAIRRRDPDAPPPDFATLDGIRTGMGTREGALAVWAHLIAFDLFAGSWVYRESRRLEAPAWVRIPTLFFTLMTGPFGLLLFLLWRAVVRGKGEALPGTNM